MVCFVCVLVADVFGINLDCIKIKKKHAEVNWEELVLMESEKQAENIKDEVFAKFKENIDKMGKNVQGL